MKFNHMIPTFTTVGVMAQAGITPLIHGALYYTLIPEVAAIIETQVLTTAQKLNKSLREVYRKDMYDIAEFALFPRYIQVMDLALTNPRNIGIEWDSKGVIQAKFVDTNALGDLGDLQRIQKMVHPGGTLSGWIGIYLAWRNGLSKKYETTVNQRLDIMTSEQIAPFWEIVENGNGPGAYPRVSPKRTLTNFKAVYRREMRATLARCVAAIRILAARPPVILKGYRADRVMYNKQTYFGHTWRSITGKSVFAISGTSGVDKMSRLTGRGFILDGVGNVLKKWSGWLPK